MNCHECQELLVAHVESMLDAEVSQTIRKHVSSCSDCRVDLEGIGQLHERLDHYGKIGIVEQVANEIRHIHADHLSALGDERPRRQVGCEIMFANHIEHIRARGFTYVRRVVDHA